MFELAINTLEKYQTALLNEECLCAKPVCHADCYCNECCVSRCDRCWDLMPLKKAIEELLQNNRGYFEEIAAKTPIPDQYYPDPDRPTQVSHISIAWADWMEERVEQLENMLMLQMTKNKRS